MEGALAVLEYSSFGSLLHLRKTAGLSELLKWITESYSTITRLCLVAERVAERLEAALERMKAKKQAEKESGEEAPLTETEPEDVNQKDSSKVKAEKKFGLFGRFGRRSRLFSRRKAAVFHAIDDPRFSKYFRGLKMGVPRAQLVLNMSLMGIQNGEEILNNPNKSFP